MILDCLKVNIAFVCPSEVYGGKANGSILAGRNFFGSESLDVGSVLIFGDAPSASVTRRVMGLLDACYPFAPKAGLLTDEAIGVQGKVKRGNQLYSPIAISLGSYMDKAAGRRACTGKKFTQDVLVLSRSCLGRVSVLSRSCLGLVSVLSR